MAHDSKTSANKAVPTAAQISECENRAYLFGLAIGSLSAAGTYFLQRAVFVRFRGLSQPTIALTSIAMGLGTLYFQIKQEMVECRKMAAKAENAGR